MFSYAMDWPLLASLTPDERQEFLALARTRRFERGEVVCHAGDPADSLHLVSRGRLAVRVSLPSGDTAMINVLGAGAYFGELALLSVEGRRTATIHALEPAETLVVGAQAFRRLCATRPTVERTLSTLLAHRVDQLSQRLLETMYVGLDRRLARRLVELARTYADPTGSTGSTGSNDPAGAPPAPDRPGRVVVPLTQSQLADICGGTRPTVNQALQRLVDQGLVELGRGRVEVLDVRRLAGKAGW